MASDEQWRALVRYVDEALHGQPPEMAEFLRGQLMEDRCRIVGVFDRTADGETIPESLAYRVDVLVADGWAPLVKVHWSRLGTSPEQIALELANVEAQAEMGITPEAWSG